jgi:hypothetical protein
MQLIHIIHVAIIGAIFLYVGIIKTNIPLFMYPVLLGLGAIVVLYHIYRAYTKKSAWVNYIHIFLVGPLLMYIGYNGVATERKFFELLMMLGFATIGYHGYYIYDEMNIKPNTQ